MCIQTRQAERVPQTEFLADPMQRDRLARRFTASFLAEGQASQAADPIRIAPEPLIIDADEWFSLRQGVVQRARLLSLLAEELRRIGSHSSRNPKRKVNNDLLDLLLSDAESVQLVQPSPSGLVAPSVVLYSVDVVRGASNGAGTATLHAVRDHLDRPSGLGSALLLRSIVGRQFGDDMASLAVTNHADYLTRMREALADLAPHGRRAPRTVVLAPMSGEVGHVETAFLATRLGHHLASPADLVVLKDRVWLRTLSGTEAVDVVLRATSGAVTDPLVSELLEAANGVAALSLAWRHDGVGLANPLGLAAFERVGQRVDGAQLLNAALETLGGQQLRLRLRSPLDSSHSPTTIRMHTVMQGDQVHVFPGGVATQVVNGVKHLSDVWVRTGTVTRSTARGRAEVPVDLADSVPTSAAEGLFWAGRNAEQAEVAARMLRMIVRHAPDSEPETLARFSDIAQAVTDGSTFGSTFGSTTELSDLAQTGEQNLRGITHALWVSSTGSVSSSIRFLNRNLQSARPFVSASTWNVLHDLDATLRTSGSDPEGATFELAEHAERTLNNLAALSGLIEESTVRSPARTFLLIGRRLQRMHRLNGALFVALNQQLNGDASQSPGLYEGLLNAWESLIAYRRRFRSDMQLDQILHLLVVDVANPRSLAFQVQELGRLFNELPRHTAHEPHQRQVSVLHERTGDETAWRRYPLDTLVAVDRLTQTLIGSVLDEWFSVDRMRGNGFFGSTMIGG